MSERGDRRADCMGQWLTLPLEHLMGQHSMREVKDRVQLVGLKVVLCLKASSAVPACLCLVSWGGFLGCGFGLGLWSCIHVLLVVTGCLINFYFMRLCTPEPFVHCIAHSLYGGGRVLESPVC